MIQGTTNMMNQDQQNFNATWHNYSDHLRAMLKDMSSDETLVTDVLKFHSTLQLLEVTKKSDILLD